MYRDLPNTPVEVRQGARDPRRRRRRRRLDDEVRALFERLGSSCVLEELMVDVAMGLMSARPAYVALVAEAMIDAGVATA